MSERLFEDLLTIEQVNKVKKELNSFWREKDELYNQIHYARGGFHTLIQKIKDVKSASDNYEDKDHIEELKGDFDKVAVLVEQFVQEFKPIYQQVCLEYMAEKLSGTLDKDEQQYGKLAAMPTYTNMNNPWIGNK